MTVKELIELLSKINPDAIVVLAADELGNRYEEFSGDIWPCVWDAENAQPYHAALTDELRAQGYTEEDLGYDYDYDDNGNLVLIKPESDKRVPAVVLWP